MDGRVELLSRYENYLVFLREGQKGYFQDKEKENTCESMFSLGGV